MAATKYPRYLKCRSGYWYLSRRLPTKRYHTVSLKTKTLKQAIKKRDAILAKWDEIISEVDKAKHVMDLRARYMDEINEDQREILRDNYQEQAEDKAYQLGVYELMQTNEDTDLLPDEAESTIDFYNTAIGKLHPLKVVMPLWLTTIENKKTRSDYRKAVARLSTKIATAEEITSHQLASAYLKQAPRIFNLSHATVSKDQTAIIHLWKYLGLDFSIWKNHSIPKTPSKTIERDCWENSEVVALLEAAKGNNRKPWLYHVINIAAHTGARETAICQCKYLEGENRVWFPKMKRETRHRKIPVHPNIKNSLAYWMENRKAPSTVTTAFTALKMSLGYTDSIKVFHSFRNSFIQQLMFNGVTEGIVSTAVGHKVNTMTFGRYGGGQALVMSLEEAIPTIDYNKPDWERVLTTQVPP